RITEFLLVTATFDRLLHGCHAQTLVFEERESDRILTRHLCSARGLALVPPVGPDRVHGRRRGTRACETHVPVDAVDYDTLHIGAVLCRVRGSARCRSSNESNNYGQ